MTLARPYPFVRLLFHGMKTTALGSLVASFLFSVLCLVLPLMGFHEISYPLLDLFDKGNYLLLAGQLFLWVGFWYVLTVIATIFPIIVGGLLLTVLIYRGIQQNGMHETEAGARGTGIGAAAGLLCSLVVAFLLGPIYHLSFDLWLSNIEDVFPLFLYIVIMATLLAAFTGRRTAKIIFKYLKSMPV